MPDGTGPLLPLRHIRTIAAVADHASLAQASAWLGISQSSLSRQIAEAERLVGMPLFQRGWAGMEPTSAGAIAISHARRMIAQIASTRETLGLAGARVGDLGHHLTWAMLDVVDAVEINGSASAAATYLGMTQPEVSRALAKVAAATGRAPFRRIREGMAPTGDVAILTGLHRQLLVDIAAFVSQLEDLLGEVTGRVAVGLLPFSEQDVIVRVFSRILALHRHVRLQAVTGSYSALTEGLRKGELDFVLGPLREPAPFPMLEETHLHDEWLTFVTRRDHPRISAHSRLPDLARESWIVGPHGTPTRRYFDDLLLQEGLSPPSQICEMITFPLAEQMVLGSDAIALLTYSQRRRSALRDGLIALPLGSPETIRRVGLTSRKDQALSLAQGLFVKILWEELAC